MSSVFTNDVTVDGPVDVSGSSIAVSNFPATQPVSGSVSVSNFPATQPVSGTVTANAGTGTLLVDGSAHTQPVSGSVSITGTVSVLTAVASSATVAQVAQSNNVDTTLLASNASRKSAIIFLPKSGTGVKYGSGASATSFTYKTGAANTTIIVTGYTGQINSFGPADTINVTELI